jgi:hypothetical protein
VQNTFTTASAMAVAATFLNPIAHADAHGLWASIGDVCDLCSGKHHHRPVSWFLCLSVSPSSGVLGFRGQEQTLEPAQGMKGVQSEQQTEPAQRRNDEEAVGFWTSPNPLNPKLLNPNPKKPNPKPWTLKNPNPKPWTLKTLCWGVLRGFEGFLGFLGFRV